jgi:hypothetical protein
LAWSATENPLIWCGERDDDDCDAWLCVDATVISGEEEPLLLARLAAECETDEHSLIPPTGLVDDSRAPTAEMIGDSRFAVELGGEHAGEIVRGWAVAELWPRREAEVNILGIMVVDRPAACDGDL